MAAKSSAVGNPAVAEVSEELPQLRYPAMKELWTAAGHGSLLSKQLLLNGATCRNARDCPA